MLFTFPALIDNYQPALTSSPVAGSIVVPSIGACFRNIFPRVARKRMRSKEAALALGTTPEIKPNLAAFEGSVCISCEKHSLSLDKDATKDDKMKGQQHKEGL